MPAPDAMLMMEPPPLRSMAGMAYLQQRKTPFRLVSMVMSHTGSSISASGGVRMRTAAALTSTSRRPNWETAALTMASIWSALEVSTCTNKASPPCSPMRRTVSSPPDRLRSATTTRAPSSTKRSEVRRPMPEDAPVTKATLSLSRSTMTTSCPIAQAAKPARRPR